MTESLARFIKSSLRNGKKGRGRESTPNIPYTGYSFFLTETWKMKSSLLDLMVSAEKQHTIKRD